MLPAIEARCSTAAVVRYCRCPAPTCANRTCSQHLCGSAGRSTTISPWWSRHRGPPAYPRAQCFRRRPDRQRLATHDRLDGPGTWLLALPAYHIAGLQVLVRSVQAGTVPIELDVSNGFDPADLPGAVAAMGSGRRYASTGGGAAGQSTGRCGHPGGAGRTRRRPCSAAGPFPCRFCSVPPPPASRWCAPTG